MTETTESRQPQSAQAAQALENPPPSETSAGTAAPQAAVERVTDVATARQQQRPPKDPKKVAAGRAGAAAKKAKNERLLEELRAAKESFRPGEASILLPKEAELKDQAPARADKPRRPQEHSWTPWIIGVALGAAGGALMLQCLRGMQPPSQSDRRAETKNPASEAAGSTVAKRQLVATPRQQPIVERHLEKRDPFHME